MKPATATLFCLLLAAAGLPLAHAGPAYDLSLSASSATLRISGVEKIAGSVSTWNQPTIVLDGVTGLITATGFSGISTAAFAPNYVLKSGDYMTGFLKSTSYYHTISSVTASDGYFLGYATGPVSYLSQGTGGTVTTYRVGASTWVVHTFTASGTFTPPAGLTTVRALVVGGGGPGGSGGGGGGGGAVKRVNAAVSFPTMAVVVAGTQAVAQAQGQTSSFGGVTAYGGGAGGPGGYVGGNGANGGGGGAGTMVDYSGGGALSGGHAGGNGSYLPGNNTGHGGGGGGAAADGGNANNALEVGPAGSGGDGRVEYIRNIGEAFGGGGGGYASSNTAVIALGGVGGGGNGGRASGTGGGAVVATAGGDNTGGGGGGGPSGGGGAAGVVILSYSLSVYPVQDVLHAYGNAIVDNDATIGNDVLASRDVVAGRDVVASSRVVAGSFFGDGSSLTGVLTAPVTFSYLVAPASFTYLVAPASFSYLVSPASFTIIGGSTGLSGVWHTTQTIPGSHVDFSTVTLRFLPLESALSTAVYTTNSYADPSWLVSLATSKVDLSTVATAISAAVQNRLTVSSPIAPGMVDLSTVIVSLNGKVPYAGSTGNVNLGIYNIAVGSITGYGGDLTGIASVSLNGVAYSSNNYLFQHSSSNYLFQYASGTYAFQYASGTYLFNYSSGNYVFVHTTGAYAFVHTTEAYKFQWTTNTLSYDALAGTNTWTATQNFQTATSTSICINGDCKIAWPTVSGGGDNLGNHTATGTLKMGGNHINNALGINASSVTASIITGNDIFWLTDITRQKTLGYINNNGESGDFMLGDTSGNEITRLFGSTRTDLGGTNFIIPGLALGKKTKAYTLDIAGDMNITSSITIRGPLSVWGAISSTSSATVSTLTVTGNAMNVGSNFYVVGSSIGINTSSPAAMISMYGQNPNIVYNNVDGNDNRWIGLSGGGALSQSRGAIAILYGNEQAATNNGKLVIRAGNVVATNDYAGTIELQTGNALNRLVINSTGNVQIGYDTPISGTSKLDINGDVTIVSTLTVTGNAFSVGGSSFSVVSGAISAPSQPTAILRKLDSQGIPDSTYSPIFWTTADRNTQSMFVITSSGVVTIPSSGVYSISCHFYLTGNFYSEISIRSDSTSNTIYNNICSNSGGGTVYQTCRASVNAYLNAGQSVDCSVYQASGGNATLSCSASNGRYCGFSAVKLW